MLQKEDLENILRWLKICKLYLEIDLTDLSKQCREKNLKPEIVAMGAMSQLINQYAQIPPVDFTKEVEWTELQSSWYMVNYSISCLRREYEQEQINADDLKRQFEYKNKQFGDLEKQIEFVENQLKTLTRDSKVSITTNVTL